MQPSKTSIEIASLKRAWDWFTTTGKLPGEIELDPLVSASWMRCGTRMNPNGQLNWVYESEGTLQSTLKQLTALRNIARPIMEDIYQYIEGCSAVLLLMDVGRSANPGRFTN
jgi:transcriptional regulator of acetoin/glycerol metabolism